MSGASWLQIVYLLAVLGLMAGTVRAHQIGGKRILVMVLAWICIFMVAVGIAMLFDSSGVEATQPPPSPGADPRFT